MLKNNLLNQKFHSLLVIEVAPSVASGAAWKCQCDCGNTKIVSANHLTSGHTKSCGCLVKQITRQLQYKNLIGKTFGLLTVISETEKNNNYVCWKCQCRCGQIINLETYKLTKNRAYSCGCQSKPIKK